MPRSRFVPLGIGKSVVIDLPRDIKDVLVADPKIANAVIRSSRRAYIIGVAVGQTNVFFFDAEGKQIAGFDIAVTRDLNGIRAAIKQTLPDADIRSKASATAWCCPARRRAPPSRSRPTTSPSRLAGDGAKVVNGIIVRGRDQVMLKVTVAEVRARRHQAARHRPRGSLNYGSSVVNFNTQNPFSATARR